MSKPQPPSSSTLVAKMSTSLDAISYIIAFFLVDAFTFGAPPKVISTIIVHHDDATQCVTEKWQSHGKSTSEGLPPPQMGSRSHSDRATNYSDGNRTGNGSSRYGSDSDGWKKSRPLSSTTAQQQGGLSQNGTLHHNQKEIFERQVSDRQRGARAKKMTGPLTSYFAAFFDDSYLLDEKDCVAAALCQVPSDKSLRDIFCRHLQSSLWHSRGAQGGDEPNIPLLCKSDHNTREDSHQHLWIYSDHPSDEKTAADGLRCCARIHECILAAICGIHPAVHRVMEGKANLWNTLSNRQATLQWSGTSTEWLPLYRETDCAVSLPLSSPVHFLRGRLYRAGTGCHD